MRTFKEVKTLAIELETLEEIKLKLEKIAVDISKVLEEGREWINEKSNLSFLEIKNTVSFEVCRCKERCLNVAGYQNNAMSSQMTTTQNTAIEGSVVDRPVSCTCSDKRNDQGVNEANNTLKVTHMKKSKSLRKKVQETEQTLNQRTEQILIELQNASSFMSLLQTQAEDICRELNDLKENRYTLDNKINALDRKLEEHLALHFESGKAVGIQKSQRYHNMGTLELGEAVDDKCDTKLDVIRQEIEDLTIEQCGRFVCPMCSVYIYGFRYTGKKGVMCLECWKEYILSWYT
ncbi:uncharacterized protein LOC106064083 [Biomphalaria glabrata]|uniref:Uncharacterized protein LOC106064083 n=1 Tax=Biomphalaria glabrata TaxID=6526 RepID=A0A9W2Z6C8_BIOGL|nr:uncharacterized protein LOC106064083 [Biomphalaria glabrata]XP_055870480.1 uncharacterized protein LOC106064083 [Biomphalaria glabrata]XP_055870481.1 uncharacterized protein LOC106064083 [Biomphalaria glabrata]